MTNREKKVKINRNKHIKVILRPKNIAKRIRSSSHPFPKTKSIKQLRLIANQIRQDIITSLFQAQSGHPGGSLGMTEIFTALYFNILNHNPQHPFWGKRDIFILSNGHICPGRYAAMANAGYFPREELLTLRKLNSRLQGHPHRNSLPGLETSSGPLGSGLSQAAGMALVLKQEKKKNRIYCMVSDGEQDCGQNWEAVMLISKYKLNNIIAIMDRNDIQIDGTTEEIMPLESLRKKYQSFGWKVLEINAHNFPEILSSLRKAQEFQKKTTKPVIIIALSTLGKGVSFMENKPEWHGKAPNAEETRKALEELKEERERIEAGKE